MKRWRMLLGCFMWMGGLPLLAFGLLWLATSSRKGGGGMITAGATR